MNNIYFIIFGMMMVTFIPRFLPFIMINNKKIPEKLQRFLKFIPPSILGALIFPGILQSVPGNIYAPLAGGLFAVVYGMFKNDFVISVIGSILVTYLVIVFI